MGLKDLKPAPGEGRRIAGGFVLSLLLHPLGLVAVGMIGTLIDRRDGYLLVVPFLALIGIGQWLYIAPAAWLLRRLGSNAVAKGVLAGGAFVTLGNTLIALGMGMKSVQSIFEVRRIQQAEREHPHDYISADGVVTVVDDTHFEFRREDGTVVSLLTWQGLDYIFLKNNGGYEKRTRDILKPGVRVSIDYQQERGKPPLDASIVRVYEEGRRN